jgi:hypothetical protein
LLDEVAMAFRIRKKRKDLQSVAKQGKDVSPRNDKEKLQELAEWDAIAESSRKPHRRESNLDSMDEEE